MFNVVVVKFKKAFVYWGETEQFGFSLVFPEFLYVFTASFSVFTEFFIKVGQGNREQPTKASPTGIYFV